MNINLHPKCFLDLDKGTYIMDAIKAALRDGYAGLVFNDVVLRFKDGDTPDKVADRYFEIIHKMR